MAGALAFLVFLMGRRQEDLPPAHEIGTPAPEAVVRASDPPDVRFTDVTAEAGIAFLRESGG